MPAGRYTPRSHLRQALKTLAEPERSRAVHLVDQAIRIIRGAPADKVVLLAGPVEEVRSLLNGLEGGVHAQAAARFEEVLQEAHEEVRAKGLAKSKEVYRTRLREVAKAREEAQAEANKEIVRLRYALKCLTGPDHTPPASARTVVSQVARPPIRAATWIDGPWTCLRLEERTIGYHEEKAYLTEWGKPALRYDPETKKWMDWLMGLAKELGLMPTDRQVRLVFFPGLAYTFAAWMEVPDRLIEQLHPMDPDNAVASSLDPLQTTPYRGKPREFGAYRNDTQVVDLLVFRIPQAGEAPVDRITLQSQARKERKARASERTRTVQHLLDVAYAKADTSDVVAFLEGMRVAERRTLARMLLKRLAEPSEAFPAEQLAELNASLSTLLSVRKQPPPQP